MALPNEPITRQEMYLSNIAGQNTPLPDAPITREEMYLDYIAKNGGTGEGDMKKSVYDSDNSVASAGGIKMFVNQKIGTIPQKVGTLETKVSVLEGEVASIEDNLDNLGTASTKNSTSVVTESSDLVESGAVYDAIKGSVGFVTTGKNLFDGKATSKTDQYGVTWTVDPTDNNVVTVSGTPTDVEAFRQFSDKVLPTGTYKFYGLSDTTNIAFNALVLYRDNTVVRVMTGITEGGEFEILSSDVYNRIGIEYKRGVNGTPCSGTIRTMITKATVTNTTYEPYHASVEESLAEKTDNTVIAPVENGSTASQAYAVGSHAIRNGAFITWKNAKSQGEPINDASDYTSGDVAEELDRIDGQIAIIEKKLFPPSVLYAFHIDGNESDPLSKVRYLEDCAGYSPAYMDFQNGIFHYGSWSENEFFMPRPCMLRYNGTVDYYLSKHDYTKKADGVTDSDVADTAYNGNAMLEFGRDNKKIWYKVVPDTGDDSSFTVYISDGQVDENFHCWSFINNQGDLVPHFYLSIYNGSVVSDVMRSISGRAVSISLTGTQEREKARANNQTSDRLWDIECFADYQLLELLTWLIGKSTDSQAVFGKGLIDSGSEAINNDFRTGVQNAKGLFFGTNSGAAATYTNAIKMFGKENLWGFQWRRLNGWCMNDGVQKIKLTKGIQDGSTATDYNDDGTNYLNMGSTLSGTSGGYVNVAYSNNKGIVIPKTVSGNSVSYYCDGLWFNNSGARLALVGGSSAYGVPCGVSCAALDVAVSFAGWGTGASLSCKPLA